MSSGETAFVGAALDISLQTLPALMITAAARQVLEAWDRAGARRGRPAAAGRDGYNGQPTVPDSKSECTRETYLRLAGSIRRNEGPNLDLNPWIIAESRACRILLKSVNNGQKIQEDSPPVLPTGKFKFSACVPAERRLGRPRRVERQASSLLFNGKMMGSTALLLDHTTSHGWSIKRAGPIGLWSLTLSQS
eukprot:SAG31_NODE_4911_length_2872_cov_1.190047_4_plen_192_part_00